MKAEDFKIDSVVRNTVSGKYLGLAKVADYHNGDLVLRPLWDDGSRWIASVSNCELVDNIPVIQKSEKEQVIDYLVSFYELNVQHVIEFVNKYYDAVCLAIPSRKRTVKAIAIGCYNSKVTEKCAWAKHCVFE